MQLLEDNTDKLSGYASLSFCGDKLVTAPGFGGSYFNIWSGGIRSSLGEITADSEFGQFGCDPSGDRLAINQISGSFKLIDLETKKLILNLPNEYGVIPAEFNSTSSRALVTQNAGSALLLIDTGTGKIVARFVAKQSYESWSFSPDGNLVVAVSSEGELFTWQAASGQAQLAISVAPRNPLTVAIDKANARIVLGNRDGSILLLDANSGALLSEIGRHEKPVARVAFGTSSDGEPEDVLFSGDVDGTLMRWDISEKGNSKLELKLSAAFAKLTGFAEGASLLAANFNDKAFVAWDARPSHPWDNGDILAMSGDSSSLCERIDHYHTVLVHELYTTNRPTPIFLKRHTDRSSFRAALSHDGKMMISIASDRTIRAWDTKNGKLLKTLSGLPDEPSGITISKNGMAAVKYYGGQAQLINTPNLEILYTFDAAKFRTNDVTFNPSNNTIVLAGRSGVSVIDLDMLKVTETFATESNVLAAAFNHSGQNLATTDADGNVVTRSTSSWSVLHSAKAGNVSDGLAFTPDDRFLFAQGSLFEAERLDLVVASSAANRWRLSPYNNAEGTVNFGKTIAGALISHRFATEPARMIAQAKDEAPRCLTPRQRAAYDLPLDPPDWCIAAKKWPYRTPAWATWLSSRLVGTAAERPPAESE